MRKALVFVPSVVFLAVAAICPALLSTSSMKAPPPSNQTLAFHERPPGGPLPQTLDPRIYREDRATYVAYTAASQIKELLYQEPCYCPCDKQIGHQSLLDCFIGDHGSRCALCRKEAVLCYRLHQKKKTAVQIRNAMASGKAWKFDFEKYVDSLFSRFQKLENKSLAAPPEHP